MNKNKLLLSIFSNWMNLALLMVIAFFISPLLVHRLGNELYGIWTLIVSITGYFTVLDFGVNTAIVRFISMYAAQKNFTKANQIYSAAFLFFSLIGLIVIAFSLVFGLFFPNLFHITQISRTYAYAVFVFAALDIACHLVFGVFSATLNALQEFVKLNAVSIALTLIKNAVLVSLLLLEYKLLAIALLQIACNAAKYGIMALLIHKDYRFFQFQRADCTRRMLRQIFRYSVYSFLIAVAGRVIFLTDSIVIGAQLTVGAVTFYAIPATLLEYIGKLFSSITGVLVPVISSQDAVGEQDKNRSLYLIVTKYLLTLSLPLMYILLTVGGDFIGIWMGAEYQARSLSVLRILVCGYIFAFPQYISYGMLGGTSKHKFLAYVLLCEAAVNLGLSLVLARMYGIEGVALGTAIPLSIVSLFVIPLYTCRILQIRFFAYLRASYARALCFFGMGGILYYFIPIHVGTYRQFFVYSSAIATLWGVFAFIAIVEPEHREWLITRIGACTRLQRR